MSSGFSSLRSFTEQRLLNYYLQECKRGLHRMSLAVESFFFKLFKRQVGNGDGDKKGAGTLCL